MPNNSLAVPGAPAGGPIYSYIIAISIALAGFLLVLPRQQRAVAAVLRLAPPAQNLSPGEQLQVKVTIDTQGASVVGAEAVLRFNGTVLRFVRAEKGDFFSTYQFQQSGDDGLAVGGTTGLAEGNSGGGVLASLVFQARKEGFSPLKFACGGPLDSSINIINPGDPQTVANIIDCGPGGIVNGAYTVGAGGKCAPPNRCLALDPTGRLPGAAKNCPGGLAAVPASCPPLLPDDGIRVNTCCPPLLTSAPPNQTCDSCGKCTGQPAPADWKQCKQCRSHKGRWTIIGCVPSSPGGFVQTLLRFVFSIVGGLAFLALLYAGGLILTARGNPAQLNQGKALLRNTFIGIFLVLLAVFILRFIGWDLFALPGWGG